MLTAYTARQAQLLDAHCDLLLVGDSLGQVIYGLPSTVPVTLEMMANHAAAVVRGSYHAVVCVDMLTAWSPNKVSGAPALPIPGIDLRQAKLTS